MIRGIVNVRRVLLYDTVVTHKEKGNGINQLQQLQKRNLLLGRPILAGESPMNQYNSLVSGLPGWLAALIGLFLIVLAIMWILLPFAIVAIQRKVIKITEESQAITRQLQETNRLLAQMNRPANKPSPEPVISPVHAQTSQTCPKCMHENRLDRSTCSRCGEELAEATA